MSWISTKKLLFHHKFCLNVLKCGPVPKHLAIIMDGNRRFASKQSVEKETGHRMGFEKLAETLLWCKEVGVKEVTVYAFSIENFKRKSEEVETLMRLAKEKFEHLLENRESLASNNVCIRIIGNLNLIPEDLRKLMCEVMLITKDNDGAFLNVAFAYTSHDEITEAMRIIGKAVRSKDLHVDDITPSLITDCMHSRKSLPLDVVIRTSGEVRFSDFMLWQTWNGSVMFTNVLWPEFTIWHFMAQIFHYQLNYSKIQNVAAELNYEERNYSSSVKLFLEKLDVEQENVLRKFSQV